jgi:hypothetical protein
MDLVPGGVLLDPISLEISYNTAEHIADSYTHRSTYTLQSAHFKDTEYMVSDLIGENDFHRRRLVKVVASIERGI